MGTTFGFSAFLKLISLNQRPRITEMQKRLRPASGGGYDFHKATRELLHRQVVDGASVEHLIAQADLIKNPYEKDSAVAALRRMVELKSAFVGTPFGLPERSYESPVGAFTVRLQPDFGAEVSGTRVGVHVWNTKAPQLDSRLARAALSLFALMFEGKAEDLAVLDLRRPALIRVGDPARHALLADRMVSYLEDTFLDLRSGRAVAPSPEDRLRP